MKKYRGSLANLILLSLICSSCSKGATPPLQNFERPLPVSVAQVEQRDVPVYIEAIGNAAASNSVHIRPQVGGTIINVFIKGGDTVKVGQYLYRIDPLPYKVALDRAEANLIKDEADLAYAKSRLERYLTLIKSDFVSKLNIEEYRRDVQKLEGQIQIDKAEIQEAKINLNYCDVVSPIDGQVSLAKVDRGNVVQPNDPNSLIVILQVEPIDINFSLPQKDFQDLQEVLREGNRRFKVLLPYGSKKEFEGELIAFDNQVNPNTGTIQLKGSVPNQEGVLWPGEFIRVRLFVKMKEQVPVVPSSAIQAGQKGAYVYILKPDQTVQDVWIKTGETVGEWTVVDEGLKPGMTVITEGQLNLKPGVQVLVLSALSGAEQGLNALQQPEVKG